MQNKSNKKSSYFRKKGKTCRITLIFPKKGEKSKVTFIWLHVQEKKTYLFTSIKSYYCYKLFHATSGNKNKEKTWKIRIQSYHYVHEPYFSEKLFMQMPIEPHLVLKHISYINTPKNPINNVR